MKPALYREEDRAAVLPRICAARLPSDGSPILIKRDVEGYWPALGVGVDAFNQRHGITPAQVEAMLVGSMFGWDVPGANPANCEWKAA